MVLDETMRKVDRWKATWKREFKLLWREAGSHNHHDDSGFGPIGCQQKFSLPKRGGWLRMKPWSWWRRRKRSRTWGAGTRSWSSPAKFTFSNRERVLYWQPTGPNPLNHRDEFSRPVLRHGTLDSLLQVAWYLPSENEKLKLTCKVDAQQHGAQT